MNRCVVCGKKEFPMTFDFNMCLKHTFGNLSDNTIRGKQE